MATGKITEKPTVEQVKEEAFFFITQQEVNEEGETVESLRRAKITSIVDALKDAGIAGIDGVEFNKITYDKDTGNLRILNDEEDAIEPCCIGRFPLLDDDGDVPAEVLNKVTDVSAVSELFDIVRGHVTEITKLKNTSIIDLGTIEHDTTLGGIEFYPSLLLDVKDSGIYKGIDEFEGRSFILIVETAPDNSFINSQYLFISGRISTRQYDASAIPSEAEWKEISASVINNLESSSTTSSLSAAQGKILNENKANKQTSEGGFEAGADADTTTGVAIGNSVSSSNGVAIGNVTSSSEDGAGVAIGNSVGAADGVSIGYDVSGANDTVLIGKHIETRSGTGVGIGKNVTVGDGISIGTDAKVKEDDLSGKYIDAIQLGTGTNETPKTLQVYNHTLMNADGTIPLERTPGFSKEENGIIDVTSTSYTLDTLPYFDKDGKATTGAGSPINHSGIFKVRLSFENEATTAAAETYATLPDVEAEDGELPSLDDGTSEGYDFTTEHISSRECLIIQGIETKEGTYIATDGNLSQEEVIELSYAYQYFIMDDTLYYRKDSAWTSYSIGEKAYEKIAEVTVTADEDGGLPAKILFTTDNEGNTFKLKKAKVVVTTDTTTETYSSSTIDVSVRWSSGIMGRAIWLLGGPTDIGKFAKTIFDLEVIDGVVYAVGTTNMNLNDNNNNSDLSSRSDSFGGLGVSIKTEFIEELSVNTYSDHFTENTKILVYGVRA